MAIQVSADDIKNVVGNAPLYLKETALRWYMILDGPQGANTFGNATRKRVRVKEASLGPSTDDQQKISIKLVGELEVASDMCNAEGVLEQGCMYALIDEGSAIALLLMKLTEGADDNINVSQTLNMLFYHPAPSVGTKLRIISRSVSTDIDGGCCSSEIWNVDQHRRIASGTQVQLAPSPSCSR